MLAVLVMEFSANHASFLPKPQILSESAIFGYPFSNVILPKKLPNAFYNNKTFRVRW